MRRTETWMLSGAWMAMAAVTAFSFYRVSESPKIDPTVLRLCSELSKAENLPPTPGRGPDPLPRDPDILKPPSRAGYISPQEGSEWFRTTLIGHGVAPKDRDILVLPFPAMESVKADLDGATITWSLETRSVEHKPWMHPKAAKPTGFTVYRERELGQPEKLGELGAAARSFSDPSTDPRRTYHYWVVLTGLETDRSNNEGALLTVTNKADRPVQVSTPPATRAKLVGGDRQHAVLRMESYDRAKKAWIPKTVLATPGELVTGTGWSLKSLRFDEFTLVAEVTDDGGAVQTLTTR